MYKVRSHFLLFLSLILVTTDDAGMLPPFEHEETPTIGVCILDAAPHPSSTERDPLWVSYKYGCTYAIRVVFLCNYNTNLSVKCMASVGNVGTIP